MNEFQRVINPCRVRVYDGPRGDRTVGVYCKISAEFIKEGNGSQDFVKLSITGVEGPLRNGDAIGLSGQINETLREYHPNDIQMENGWDREMFDRFLDIWDRWYLNHMYAVTPEMRAAGWVEQAKEEAMVYKFSLSPKTLEQIGVGRNRAHAALKSGETLRPTAEEVMYANLPYDVKVITDVGAPEPEAPEHYARARLYTPSRERPAERSSMCWLTPSEHPRGLLGREFEDTGKKFGAEWYREELPQDVYDFLISLPLSDTTPAWV